MANYKTLPAEAIPPAAEFIRACLRFDVKERATTKDLLVHRWLADDMKTYDDSESATNAAPESKRGISL
jgi:serine/threonine protein kinase